MIDKLQFLRREANRSLTELDYASRAVKEEKARLVKAEQEVIDAERTQQIVQQVAVAVQLRVHQRIGSVVSKCLSAVFADPYTFKIDFVQRRGKTEADITFVRDGYAIDPVNAASGGVKEVAGFAARVACLVMSTPALRRVLLLDEPYSALSSRYHPAVRDMLRMLAKDLGVQMIVVSHSPRQASGKIYNLEEME